MRKNPKWGDGIKDVFMNDRSDDDKANKEERTSERVKGFGTVS